MAARQQSAAPAAGAAPTPDGALAGLRVLEICAGRAGAYCGKLLSDLGAEVVKLEPFEGDPARRAGPFPPRTAEASGLFLYLNTGKRSVRSNGPIRRDAIAHLLESADVLIEDWDAGRRAELLPTVPEQLIWCSITAFGVSGPYAGFKGMHLNVFHAGGEGHLLPSGEGYVRFPRRPPLQAGASAGDADTGANAAVAVLAAWLSGRGQRIDVSAQESQLTLNRTRLSRFNHDGVELRRTGPPYPGAGMFGCRDGWVQMLGPQDEHWKRLGEVAGEFADPRFATAQGRREHAGALRGLLSAWCAQRSRAEVVAVLSAQGFAVGAFKSAADVAASEQLASRQFFQVIDQPGMGRVTLPGVPYRFSATPVVLRRAPRLGEHAGFAAKPRRSRPTPPAGQPLAGLRIVDFTWAAAGPYATLLLGLFGAEVIKVESSRRPDPARRGFMADYGGVNNSPNFNELNLNKRSLRIDLTQPRGLELVKRLVGLSDMVVDNFRPGVMKRFGLDAATLIGGNPRLIVASSSGNGSTGPEAMTAGLASIFSAAGGLSEQTGYADGPPTEIGESTDYRSGNALALALLVALIHRERTGAGQFIDLSSTETVAALAPDALLAHLFGAPETARLGNRHCRHAPHNLFRAAGEDEWISIAVTSQPEWRALCGLIGRIDWSEKYPDAASRKADEDEIDAAIEAWTVQRDAHEAFLLLQAQGIPAAPSLTNSQLARDAHLAARDVFVDVPHPVIGTHRLMRAPWIFRDNSVCSIRRHGPLLGQDNDHVLGELLGLSAEERAACADVLC
jgi:crotonobetainyl-CoA:carnitine CoA-transferase CaiB-like acyl-CoA transferase